MGEMKPGQALAAKRLARLQGALGPSTSTPSAAANMGVEQKKARILCLHGYENSGSILKKQLGMSGWLKELGTTCDFVFASAPFDSALPVTPIVQQYFPKDPKCQWFERIEHLDTGGVRYVGLNKGLGKVSEILRGPEGPFDGILGFSQGAAMSVYTIARQQQWENSQQEDRKDNTLPTHPPLKFAIIIAGFIPRDIDNRYLFEGGSLSTPTCHIWGDHDVLKYKSQDLTKSCEDPLVMVHASGHKVPNTKTIDVDKLRAFIATKTT